MQIHRVRGNDLKDALTRARRNYGDGALVISHEVTADGGVTLAVAQRPAVGAKELKHLQRETTTSPEAVSVQPMAPPEVELPPGFEEVRTRLISNGCSEDWSRSICLRASKRPSEGEHPMDTVGKALGGDVRIARLPKTPGVTRVIAFVGNTGVGKTTGLVKLGARLVRGRRKISLATLDSRRVGAVEQYRAYADLLGAPLEVLKSEQVLTPESIGAPGQDVVLLDTTGRSECDLPPLLRLQERLSKGDGHTRLDTFLVLPATSSRAALREVSEAFGDLPLAGCVITKLDETKSPAPVFEHAIELGLPVAFLSNGQDIGRNFQRATPELLADLMLLGRLG